MKRTSQHESSSSQILKTHEDQSGELEDYLNEHIHQQNGVQKKLKKIGKITGKSKTREENYPQSKSSNSFYNTTGGNNHHNQSVAHHQSISNNNSNHQHYSSNHYGG